MLTVAIVFSSEEVLRFTLKEATAESSWITIPESGDRLLNARAARDDGADFLNSIEWPPVGISNDNTGIFRYLGIVGWPQMISPHQRGRVFSLIWVA